MDNGVRMRPEATATRDDGASAHVPVIPASESPAEFTLKAVVPGILFGIVFGAANAYLGLRAGLTISTSIPVAVMTVAAFHALRRIGVRGTLLEANLSQTIGSASSSVASGVIFTLPALFLWDLDPTLVQMTLLAMCGGMLGVLFMIPLRAFLIEREHGRLPYPEGTACAEVLAASQVGGGRARNVFLGLGAGAALKLLTDLARVVPEEIHVRLPLLRKGELGMKASAALLGVGYILGPRVASIMLGGGLLSSLVLIPALDWWGRARTTPMFPEATLLIGEMSAGQLWSRYVRYIGAGAVAAAGLITLVRSVPTMIESFRVGARQLRAQLHGAGGAAAAVPRTKHDLSLLIVGGGVVTVAAALALIPHIFGALEAARGRIVAAALVVMFAFFFVTVASRIVGLVGVTSNPTSGMTIATLLGTSTVFLLLGWTDDVGKVAALTVGCVVAIAASISGDTSQDLKTGFLLGATPWRQQVGEMIGVLTSAACVCLVVIWLDRAYGFGTEKLPAPQATLMKLVIDGVLQQALPWTLVGIGVAIAVVIELCRLPSLPFAVGVYLPVSTMVPVFIGGALRWAMERRAGSRETAASRREQGVLFGSGLVGGEGLLGVMIAGIALALGRTPAGIGPEWAVRSTGWAGAPALAGLIVFMALMFVFGRAARRRHDAAPK